jgi:ferric-dicitrate binding protein FerR (iron transport regulator)
MAARQAVAVAVALLLAFPAWTNPVVVGSTLGSQQARVRGAELVPGTTIFSGDVIEVGPKGQASLNLSGGAQVDVAAESKLRLSKDASRVVLELGRGAAAFRSTASAPVEAKIADATIRAAEGSTAAGVVAWRGLNAGVIAAKNGQLLITTAHDGRTVVLNEGEGIEFAYAPAANDDDDDISRAGIIIFGAVIIGLATLAAILLNRNSRDLNQNQQCNQVSPFQPCP